MMSNNVSGKIIKAEQRSEHSNFDPEANKQINFRRRRNTLSINSSDKIAVFANKGL